jgi:hypothetical protein
VSIPKMDEATILILLDLCTSYFSARTGSVTLLFLYDDHYDDAEVLSSFFNTFYSIYSHQHMTKELIFS